MTSRKIAAFSLALSIITSTVMSDNRDLKPDSDAFHFPTTGVTVKKQAMLLGIDDYLLPIRENVGTYLSTPTYRKEPVVAPSKDDPKAPDSAAAHFYGAVIERDGKYQMWYYAVGMKVPGDAYKPDVKGLTIGPVCYAESDDGIHWTKPNLGQMEVHGSEDNNGIALPDKQTSGVHVILDEDDSDPSRRYKMVYNTHNEKTWVIRTATSADGIHWKAAEDFAIDQFLETASLYKFNDLFIVHGQRITFSEGGHASGRQGRAVLSPDFAHWLAGDTNAFALPEPVNPEERGQTQPYDQVHLGVGAQSFGNVAVGFYGLWHNQQGDESSQERWGWFGYGKISCDLGLVISNDGLHFREPVKGHVYISRFDSPSTPMPGKNYPTVLTQSGNGILNVGDKTLIYFGRWLNAEYNQGYRGEVAMATLPRDRWGALGLHPTKPRSDEPLTRGSVWSAPVTLSSEGGEVFLNADGVSNLSVEISDSKFRLLDKYSGSASGRSAAPDGLDCPVVFTAGDLSGLAGQTVRFKINFEKDANVDPRLFAVYLRTP